MTHELKVSVINLLTTTACNAWDLPDVEGSPGVCWFCYRETRGIRSTDQRLRAAMDKAVEHFGAERFTMTGGEPTMSPWFGPAVWLGADGGITVDPGGQGGRNTYVGNLIDDPFDQLLTNILEKSSSKRVALTRPLPLSPKQSRPDGHATHSGRALRARSQFKAAMPCAR